MIRPATPEEILTAKDGELYKLTPIHLTATLAELQELEEVYALRYEVNRQCDLLDEAYMSLGDSICTALKKDGRTEITTIVQDYYAR